jgi:hypothetical protein
MCREQDTQSGSSMQRKSLKQLMVGDSTLLMADKSDSSPGEITEASQNRHDLYQAQGKARNKDRAE